MAELTQTVKAGRYVVTATRSFGMWELDVPGVGVTQAERASEAEDMVRDLIDILAEDDADKTEIHIEWHLGGGLDEEVAEAARARQEAQAKSEAAAKAARNAAAHMKSAGLTGRDIAAVLGVSEQRVSQLLNAKSSGDRARPKTA
ncbi:hypothetical protein [Glycomyces salinus]|uniref:hypothetical protein n=1 Tax=Glycomyces salinus TaxID=980294 RepID=UPI0018EB00DA|nr:hypothetical protein [Glycomyces salinus]